MIAQRCALLIAVAIVGCGGRKFGDVEGTVKLDDKPLAGARVVFQPEDGRPSFGETDENGHYELQYTNDRKGAVVGKHKVMIRTFREADPGAEDESKRKKRKELVPAQYNAETTLEVEVKPGSNEPFDFNLKPGGKIVNPDDEDDEANREGGDCC